MRISKEVNVVADFSKLGRRSVLDRPLESIHRLITIAGRRLSSLKICASQALK